MSNNETNTQPEAIQIPTGFPGLPDHLTVANRMSSQYGFKATPSRVEFIGMQQDWQIEQRLGEINQARTDGSMTPEEADTAELEALRTMRALRYGSQPRVPLETIYEVAAGLGVEVVGQHQQFLYRDTRDLRLYDPTQQ